MNNNDFTVLVSGSGTCLRVSVCTVWPCIQDDRESRTKNFHQTLHWALTFLRGNYSDDSEGHSYGQLVIGSFITTMHPLVHHIPCRVFWWNIKSPRWLSPTTAQIWHPVTSCFSQSQNHVWKGRDIRPWNSEKYDRTADGDWENCVRRLLLGDWGVTVLCTMFLVPCIFFNKYFYFSDYMVGYLLDRPHVSWVYKEALYLLEQTWRMMWQVWLLLKLSILLLVPPSTTSPLDSTFVIGVPFPSLSRVLWNQFAP